jgi:hypothetical protein
MIEGTDEGTWMARDGSHVRENRTKIVAGCLNELRQGDEVGRYFTGPPGDVKNLRAKIRFRVKSATDAKRDAARGEQNAGGEQDTRKRPGQPDRTRIGGDFPGFPEDRH